MRGLIMDALFERMAADPAIFFLTADMGINLVERFQAAYPKRFLNVGIAEQDLIGVSAGLCNAGFRPFAYTISNFLVHRCFEQIRNDIALHHYPVTLLGTSAGFDNAPLGPTHHVVYDWGAVAGIPGIDIYTPSSAAYAATIVDRVLIAERPAYVRIPKGRPPEPHAADHVVYLPAKCPGVLVASYGSPAQHAIAAANGYDDVSTLVFNRLRPLAWQDVAAAIEAHDDVIVVEDHFPEHGLYGTLVRMCVENGVVRRFRSLAPRDYSPIVGTSSAYYERQWGIDAPGIEQAIRVCRPQRAPVG